MSEQKLTTMSKTSIHRKNFKFFFSLRRPETLFRHAQSHQRAGALTGSINIFQNRIITVYEVESRSRAQQMIPENPMAQKYRLI